MKMKKSVVLFVILLLLVFVLTGCGKQQPTQMVNEFSFSLDNIKELTISYDDEEVTFFQSENENLVVREYMNQDKDSYHAEVSQDDNRIKISEGGKPFFKGDFVRYIEIDLPASYHETLKVTTTDGNIDLSDMTLDMESLRIDSTSGSIRLGKAAASDIYLSSTSGKMELGTLQADRIRIDTTKGSVVCEQAEGNVAYTSTSGDAEFLSAIGSGTYKANNSGKLSVVYEKVTGDLFLYNKNDAIILKLPETLEFEFEATTKNGSVKTDFQGNFAVHGNTTSGIVGSSPTVTVKTETKNGNIEVTR